MFEFLHSELEKLRDLSYETSIFSDSLIVLGASFVLWLLLSLSSYAIKVFKLYVWSQFRQTDYVKRYGKWALVTGATDGIGLEFARELARRGHSVILVGRNEEKLVRCKKLVSKEALDSSCEVMVIKLDLSVASVEDYEVIAQQIDSQNLEIGILINNAATTNAGSRLHNQSIRSMIDIVNVNCLAAALFTRIVLPGMLLRNRGLIVNVSSMAGHKPYILPFTNLYSPSKAFIQQLSNQLKREYTNNKYPIDVIDFDFGFINGGLWSKLKRPNLMDYMITTPDKLAKSLINCMASKYDYVSGHFSMELQRLAVDLARLLGLSRLLEHSLTKLTFKEYNVTPTCQRRNKYPLQLSALRIMPTG